MNVIQFIHFVRFVHFVHFVHFIESKRIKLNQFKLNELKIVNVLHAIHATFEMNRFYFFLSFFFFFVCILSCLLLFFIVLLDVILIFRWDFETRSIVSVLSGHPDIVSSISFSRNGRRLLASDYSGYLILWDIYQGKPLIKLKFNCVLEYSWLHQRVSLVFFFFFFS